MPDNGCLKQARKYFHLVLGTLSFWVVVGGLSSLCAQSAPESVVQPGSAPANPPQAPQIETIICIRHGEKATGGLGQLNTVGLNRALALPDVLIPRYGKPAFIFAPDPGADKMGEGFQKEDVCYVRPLLTIGPTAIRCGLPIDTSYGYRHIDDLQAQLDQPAYFNTLVFIAWEHVYAEKLMRNIVVSCGGQPGDVPFWHHDDFDSIYIAQITRSADGRKSVRVHIDHEGLNGMSSRFPSPAPKS
jgi:hypothetical protein